VNITLVDPKELTPHEDVDLRLIKARFNEIKSGLVYPIVVEKNLKFIIDGHHRWYVFYELGLKVPAFFVDYSLVENSSWRLKALIEDLKTDRDGEVCIEYNGLRLLCEDDYYTFYWSLYEEIVKRGLDPLAVKLSAEGVPLPALPKQEVIRAAKLGIVYPPKTTRHILEFKLQPVKMLTSDGDA